MLLRFRVFVAFTFSWSRASRCDVYRRWQDRACDAYGRIEELEEELEQVRYAVEVIGRLLEREQEEALRAGWRTRLAATQQAVAEAERELAVQRREEDACWAIVEEMAAELGEGRTTTRHFEPALVKATAVRPYHWRNATKDASNDQGAFLCCGQRAQAGHLRRLERAGWR